ncbi:MAG: sensor histidine kinase [Streptosporangiaceae bacterium]
MSIRLRLAVVFTVAAAALFALGSVLFVSQLSARLLSAIDAQLKVSLGQAARYLPGPGARPVAGGRALPGAYAVQLIAPAGRVRGASPDAGTAPMLPRAALPRAARGQIVLFTSEEGERTRLMAQPLAGHRGWVAVAGTPLEGLDSTLADVTHQLVIAGAVFAAAAGLGSYGLARAALSPVERMRREVAALSERDEAPGVAVPRTRDEIAALAVTMNGLLDRLHRALSRQRALVADASHELRTPLAVLSGELELAGRPGRGEQDLREATARAADEVARLARLTDQLLFLARSDEHRAPPRREQADVAALLGRSAQLRGGQGSGPGVACQVQAPAGLVADIDPDRIREGVDNLVDNALRYAPAGTPVTIRAAARGRDLIIEVADRGPGFPAEFLPRAFERFARPDSGRSREDGGAGLGLAIVSAIAAAHGGRAAARNRDGGGAVVTIELPGAVVTAGDGPAADPLAADGPAPFPAAGSQRPGPLPGSGPAGSAPGPGWPPGSGPG